jgi:methylase of polypeptide subunit release factors
MTGPADSALLNLLRLLNERSYDFVTPTPASHARVVARPDKAEARDLRDVFGWNVPFAPGTIDPKIADLLRHAGMIETLPDGLLHSRLRVSRLHGRLFLHSAFPTDAPDSVFFGPDSYRFADVISSELRRTPLAPGAHVVDIGAGTGVGGIVAASVSDDARVTLTDVNTKALRLARINAAAAGVTTETFETDSLTPVKDPIDAVVINPPYIADNASRAYRDGGGLYGGEVPLEMARMAADRLAPGGRLILYTGAAIVDGRNLLSEALMGLAAKRGFALDCREIDPDVFGEELAGPAYRDVERIALIVVTLARQP